MRILLTGVSSFTGAWFTRALLDAGHHVICPLRRRVSDYEPLRQTRIRELAAGAQIVEDCAFGTTQFAALLSSAGPFDVLCHHAAEVTNYRSADFDYLGAAKANTLGFDQVITQMNHQSFLGVIATGSVFETDEGLGEMPRRAFSAYGLSKTLSWQILRFKCESLGIRLAKFVVPNPVGPYEEPRFTTSLVKAWARGETPAVNTPDYVRDNIPVDLLARCYARFVDQMSTLPTSGGRMDPSGFAESQGAYTLRFADAMRPRLGFECKALLNRQTNFAEPMTRTNSTPAHAIVPSWSEAEFWEATARYYREHCL